MLYLTHQQILDSADGSPIPAVRLFISKVWPIKTGTHPQHGEWSFQNCDATLDGKPIKVKLENRPDASEMTGKKVTVQAAAQKRGYSGLYVKDDSYQSKKTGEQVSQRIIRITGSAEITDGWGEGASGQPTTVPFNPTSMSVSKPQQQEDGQWSSRSSSPALAHPERLEDYLDKAASLLKSCHDAAWRFTPDADKPNYQPEEGRCLFIQATRDGWLNRMDIPAKAVSEPPYPQPTASPKTGPLQTPTIGEEDPIPF